jgi:hypothetical protein
VLAAAGSGVLLVFFAFSSTVLLFLLAIFSGFVLLCWYFAVCFLYIIVPWLSSQNMSYVLLSSFNIYCLLLLLKKNIRY